MAIRNDFAPGEVLAAADLNDTFGSKRVLQETVVFRQLAAQNSFDNATSFIDFPQASDKSALDLTFTKQDSTSIIVLQSFAQYNFTSGATQAIEFGININGTDYAIARMIVGSGFNGIVAGCRSVSGIASGALTVKPRLRTSGASAINLPENSFVSYSVREILP
jgi:hypothetical protein